MATNEQKSQVLAKAFCDMTLNAPSEDNFGLITVAYPSITDTEKSRLRTCLTVAQAELIHWYFRIIPRGYSALLLRDYGDAMRSELAKSDIEVLLEDYVLLQEERTAFFAKHAKDYHTSLTADGTHTIHVSDLIFGLVTIRRDAFDASLRTDWEEAGSLLPFGKTGQLVVKGFLGKESSTVPYGPALMAMIGVHLVACLNAVQAFLSGDNGDTDATTNAELMEEDTGQSNFDELSQAAEQGQATSQLKLGFMYRLGRGVAQDHKQAVSWFHKAAAQGLADAEFALGLMYFEGLGVATDYSQAVSLYQKAAVQGLAEAQHNLGLVYTEGICVVKDDRQAFSWYQKAAAQGLAEAQLNLGLMYDQGRGVSQDDKQAATWYQKAAAQGNASAQFNLGNMYYKGQGVTQDHRQAVSWYQKAAAHGLAVAQFTLGLMYVLGEGVAQDLVRSSTELYEIRY